MWEFKKSALARYKHDTAKLISDCYETDWNRSKVHRVVKDEKEREKKKTYMRSVFKHFRNMYMFTAGQEPLSGVPCIGANVFADLTTNGLPTLIDKVNFD